jgi:hypothetical protein
MAVTDEWDPLRQGKPNDSFWLMYHSILRMNLHSQNPAYLLVQVIPPILKCDLDSGRNANRQCGEAIVSSRCRVYCSERQLKLHVLSTNERKAKKIKEGDLSFSILPLRERSEKGDSTH